MSDLYDLARGLLDAVVAWYEDADVDLPSRQYVSDGLPALDFTEDSAGQLTVQVMRTFYCEGDPMAEVGPNNMAAVEAAELEVVLVRCAPIASETGDTLTVPGADEIEDSAQSVLSDQELIRASFDQDLSMCKGVTPVHWASIGPEGGIVGGIWTIRALVP